MYSASPYLDAPPPFDEVFMLVCTDRYRSPLMFILPLEEVHIYIYIYFFLVLAWAHIIL